MLLSKGNRQIMASSAKILEQMCRSSLVLSKGRDAQSSQIINKRYLDAVGNDFITLSAVAPFAMTAARFYSAQPKPKPSAAESKHSSTSSSASMSSSANLPDKAQMEKYFFKTVAFLYDVSTVVYSWSRTNFQKYVIANPNVQAYWKKFHEKMEQAKRD